VRVSWLWLAFALTPACSFNPGSLSAGDAGGDGTAIDARIDAPTDQTCVGGGLYAHCYATGSEPTMDRELSAAIDTDNACGRVESHAGGPDLCVIEAQSLTLTADIDVRGSRPLVLLAMTTITLPSGVDLDFSADGGAPSTGCTATPGTDDTSGGSSAGGGGGGGGSFSGAGADGGDSQSAAAGGTTGATLPLAIRAGCRGAAGGTSSAGNGGLGGAPGGALYLVAGQSIEIHGDIFANGAGGKGGPNKAGGGGGGSGGLIALDAPTVTLDSTTDLVANGGAGGEGGGGGGSGADGETATVYDARPDGGQSNSNGSNGGDGAYNVTTAPTQGANSGDGGGGGGGGFGYVRVFATTKTLSARISPAAL
jgi:hypothetical protein